uniref:Uncharacterized protein n=1 Tax=Avena sativa TaxID=4498 RepID=A0ACD5X6H6_AVESA
MVDISSVHLSPESPDTRLCRFTNKELSNKSFYAHAFRHLQIDVQASWVWGNAAPLQCKIFCWLACRHRLSTNERRFRHQLSPSAACPSCTMDEASDHLLITCHRAYDIWSFFFPPAGGPIPCTLGEISMAYCRSFEETTICVAILWNIWKRRNTLVFNGVDEPPLAAIKWCTEDVRLWAHRCKRASSASQLNLRCNQFDPP